MVFVYGWVLYEYCKATSLNVTGLWRIYQMELLHEIIGI